MRLTDHTDYSLRTLMYLNQIQQKVTLSELSDRLKISRNNLIKVSNQLAKLGLVETSMGRSGGLILKVDARKISLKQIIEQTEENFNLAECFPRGRGTCTYRQSCLLKTSLKKALDAFLESLEGVTLADVTPKVSSRF